MLRSHAVPGDDRAQIDRASLACVSTRRARPARRSFASAARRRPPWPGVPYRHVASPRPDRGALTCRRRCGPACRRRSTSSSRTTATRRGGGARTLDPRSGSATAGAGTGTPVAEAAALRTTLPADLAPGATAARARSRRAARGSRDATTLSSSSCTRVLQRSRRRRRSSSTFRSASCSPSIGSAGRDRPDARHDRAAARGRAGRRPR